MRAPPHGPWQILARVLGPGRLLASGAPTHQRTCNMTESQAMWYKYAIIENKDNDSDDGSNNDDGDDGDDGDDDDDNNNDNDDNSSGSGSSSNNSNNVHAF